MPAPPAARLAEEVNEEVVDEQRKKDTALFGPCFQHFFGPLNDNHERTCKFAFTEVLGKAHKVTVKMGNGNFNAFVHLKNHHPGVVAKLRAFFSRTPPPSAAETDSFCHTLLQSAHKKIGRVSAFCTKAVADEKSKWRAKLVFQLVSYLIETGAAFSDVENAHFRQFVKMIHASTGSLESPPTFSRDMVANQVLPTLRQLVQKLNKDQMSQEATSVSLTIDGWSDIGQRHYLGVTAHFVANDWTLQSLQLGCIPAFGVEQTAEKIVDILRHRLDSALPEDILIACVTSDNAGNMINAVNLFSGEDGAFRCIAHTTQLVVKEFLNAFASGLIGDVRAIVQAIRGSTAFSNALLDLQAEPKLHLVDAVDTRWDSTFYMLRRFVSLLQPVHKLCATGKLDKAISGLSFRFETQQIQTLIDVQVLREGDAGVQRNDVPEHFGRPHLDFSTEGKSAQVARIRQPLHYENESPRNRRSAPRTRPENLQFGDHGRCPGPAVWRSVFHRRSERERRRVGRPFGGVAEAASRFE